MPNQSPLLDLVDWLGHSHSVVVFTGAGISTESGIPDFRSPGGIWSREQPVYFDDFLASESERLRYWRQKSEAHRRYFDAKPNVGHEIIAKWESRGIVRGVITQNIDGLHQLAGSRSVVELHGTARQVGCVECSFKVGAEPMVAGFLETAQVPLCPECNAPLKHATISFGQQLSNDVLSMAADWCESADLLLAAGSSLVVTPAADLPRMAQARGAKLAIINRDETALDEMADCRIHASIGETLQKLDSALSETA